MATNLTKIKDTEILPEMAAGDHLLVESGGMAKRIPASALKQPGMVFDTAADMEAYITSHADKLTVGMDLLIRAEDEPDYWWDGEKAVEVEIDLSGVKAEIAGLKTGVETNSKAIAANGVEIGKISDEIADKTENATVYDLDCVREIVGENLWTEGDIESKYTTGIWVYVSKGMSLPAGTYTLVLPNMKLSSNGYIVVGDAAGSGAKEYISPRITKIGVYEFTIPDDGTYSGTLYIRMQINEDTAEEADLYYVRGIRLYNGDVSRGIIPLELTGAGELTETQISGNLLNLNAITYGMYVYSDGSLKYNASYNVTDYIPVVPGDILRYQFTYGTKRYDATSVTYTLWRFVSVYDSQKKFIGNLANNATTYIVPEGAAFVRLTMRAEDFASPYSELAVIVSDSAEVLPYKEYYERIVVKAENLPIDDDTTADNRLWSSQRITEEIRNIHRNSKIISIDETIQALESSVALTVPQLKKNKTIAFSGVYSGDLTEITIVQGEGSGFTEVKCVVTATNVTIAKNSAEVYTAEHGLIFGSHFSIVLATKNNNNSKVYLASGGNKFESAEFQWNSSKPELKLYTNVPFTHYQFTFGSNDFDKKIWMYGDSYFDHWLPVSIDRGYTNCLTDGWSGGSSAAGRSSFELSIKHGTPSIVVWCLGMNNGDDGAINQSWLDSITAVKEICDSKGIDLWVTTIPNVPTRDHTYKNAYIRENFKYIDISKLVGAEESTSWYEGLLYTDNVHPSAEGDFYIANIMETYFPEMLEA